jgi:hypothetical protein
MKAATTILLCAAMVVVCAVGASAQNVISLKSGTINYTDGDVLLDAKAVKLKAGTYPRMAVNQQLEAKEGRAEILLGPGSVLRLGENSSVKMLGDSIEDTRLELVSGSAMVECVEQLKDNAVTLVYKDATIRLLRNGLYRLDAEPAQLSVYEGEASVEQGGQTVTVKGSRLLALNSASAVEKFDTHRGDTLFRWTRQRAEYMALANMHAAASARRGTVNGWMWSGIHGMFTYLPTYGMYRDYWGNRYYSPGAYWDWRYYRQVGNPFPANANNSGGYYGVSATSAGTSGTAASYSPPSAASSASSAPVSRSSGSASGARR